MSYLCMACTLGTSLWRAEFGRVWSLHYTQKAYLPAVYLPSRPPAKSLSASLRTVSLSKPDKLQRLWQVVAGAGGSIDPVLFEVVMVGPPVWSHYVFDASRCWDRQYFDIQCAAFHVATCTYREWRAWPTTSLALLGGGGSDMWCLSENSKWTAGGQRSRTFLLSWYCFFFSFWQRPALIF